jgi:uncharacterized coiled-coil DUF342 family protein
LTNVNPTCESRILALVTGLATDSEGAAFPDLDQVKAEISQMLQDERDKLSAKEREIIVLQEERTQHLHDASYQTKEADEANDRAKHWRTAYHESQRQTQKLLTQLVDSRHLNEVLSREQHRSCSEVVAQTRARTQIFDRYQAMCAISGQLSVQSGFSTEAHRQLTVNAKTDEATRAIAGWNATVTTYQNHAQQAEQIHKLSEMLWTIDKIVADLRELSATLREQAEEGLGGYKARVSESVDQLCRVQDQEREMFSSVDEPELSEPCQVMKKALADSIGASREILTSILNQADAELPVIEEAGDEDSDEDRDRLFSLDELKTPVDQTD